MHKIFGVKCEVSYVDRKGAYLIPFHNDKIGVVQTLKVFFSLAAVLMKTKPISSVLSENVWRKLDMQFP